MKFTFLLTLVGMIAMGSLGGFVSTAERQHQEAERMRAEKEKNESIAIRWDGPKKMFCESQIFRVGNQRVCLLVKK